MATVATTTRADPLVYPNTGHIHNAIPAQGHRLYTAVINAAGTGIDWYKAADAAGTSWSLRGTYSPGHTIVELASIFLDNSESLWFAYRANVSSEDRIYINRMHDSTTFAAASSGALLANQGNGGSPGSVYTGLDMIAVRLSDNSYRLVVAAGYQTGSQQGIVLYSCNVSSGSVYTANPLIVANKRMWLTAGTGRISPTIDIEHNGDGKSGGGGSPHLWVTYGRTSMRLVKCTWTGSGWTGPTSDVALVTGVTAADQMPGRWTGQEWIGVCPNPADGTTVLMVQRNRANTSTTTNATATHPTGVIRNCTFAYDSVRRDVRIYAVGTSTAVLYYCDYIRATGLFSAWSTVVATAILGSPPNNYSVRRNTYGLAKYDVVTAHSGSPNTIVHTQQSLSYPPTAPAWEYGTNATTPSANGVAMDVSASMILDWLFTDPDPGDTQSAYALSRQIGAAAIAYYRASDATWQASEQQNSSGTSSVTLLAATWATGGASAATHVYRVKVWDSAVVASGYSTALSIVPSSKANPSFATPSSGGTITNDTVAITWTVSEQTAYRVTLATNPGGVVMYDSGWVQSTDLAHTPSYTLATGTGWTIGLTTRNNEGLASTTQTRNFSVSYVTPAVATTVASPQPAMGVIRVTITNPAPGGGQPAFASQSLWRRVVGDTSEGVQVATNLSSAAVYDDFTAVSGISYEYRSVVSGINGTTSTGTFTP